MLRAAADGGALDRDEAHAFAREWLAATGGDAALRVLTGGTFEAARVVDLCDLVLRLLAMAPEAGESDAES